MGHIVRFCVYVCERVHKYNMCAEFRVVNLEFVSAAVPRE